MLSDGTWTYTWEHGRELATMSNGSTTWTNTYNADGLRTKRTNGSTTYSYVYNGSSLSQMTVGSNTLYFAYDASGTPMSVTYNDTNYYYATNLQGDVTAILNTSGTAVVQYTYDAWGNILTTTGSMASTLGAHNPLRYRGYVYDQETTLYYLQSRYYDPEMGRFINADALASTGQGILGNNMFAYCRNNPTSRVDSSGKADVGATEEAFDDDVDVGPNDKELGGGGSGGGTQSAGKGFSSFGALKNFLGSAGTGKHWHHIVEQSQMQKSGFTSEQVNNTSNVVAVDAQTHAKISGYYNTTTFRFTNGLSVRNWLAGQSFQVQFDFGMNVLQDFGVIS